MSQFYYFNGDQKKSKETRGFILLSFTEFRVPFFCIFRVSKIFTAIISATLNIIFMKLKGAVLHIAK